MANFNISSVNALFDASPLPLLLFGVSGQVNFANRAALNHPGKPAEAMGGQDIIKKLISDATLGVIKLPYEADIQMLDGSLMHGRFMPGPSGLDIAFVMMTGEDDGYAAQGMKLKDIIELLKAEVSPPVQYLLRQVDTLSTPEGSQLAQAADILKQRLSRLGDLINVFGDDIVNTSDRMELPPLVRQVCEELALKVNDKGVRFKFAEIKQTLPPIYGNQRLLKRAFYECIDNAVTYSRHQTDVDLSLDVEIRFTFSGQHILVGIRNQGATSLKVNNQEKLRPFVQAGKTIDPMNKPMEAPRMGLPLVQRIVALHGGNMRLNTVDADTVQILMEFPTGAPVRGNKDLDKAQAEAYAKDLAQLMSRRKKERK
jgi:hypothetical protein